MRVLLLSICSAHRRMIKNATLNFIQHFYLHISEDSFLLKCKGLDFAVCMRMISSWCVSCSLMCTLSRVVHVFTLNIYTMHFVFFIFFKSFCVYFVFAFRSSVVHFLFDSFIFTRPWPQALNDLWEVRSFTWCHAFTHIHVMIWSWNSNSSSLT